MTEYYWHFVRVDEDGTPRLRYYDGREVKIGETIRVEEDPELCKRGLHASAKVWDALRHASGEPIRLCRVTLGGMIAHDIDKSVANERTVIAMLDADATEKLLREWSRWCALQVVHFWDAPDEVRQYLGTGDESLLDATRGPTMAMTRPPSESGPKETWVAWAAGVAAYHAVRDRYWDADNVSDAAACAFAYNVMPDPGNKIWTQEGSEIRKATIDQYAAELERRAMAAMGINEDVSG